MLYHWRVRAVNGVGVGPWASAWKFTSAIQGPYIRLTSPNGGEYLVDGAQHLITWESQGTSGQFRIEVLLDLGHTYEHDAILPHPGYTTGSSYLWTVSGQVPGHRSEYYVRIYDNDDDSIADTSDYRFSIGPEEPLRLTSPNGGEVWPLAGLVSLIWERPDPTLQPGQDLEGQLYKGETLVGLITQGMDAWEESYSWMLPAGLDPGDDYRFALRSKDNNDIEDISDGPFTISPNAQPSITVSAPALGGQCEQQRRCYIRWTHSLGLLPVTIELYQDAFVETLTTGDADGVYRWPVRTTPQGATYRIRVSDDQGLEGFSEAFAVIGPPLPDPVVLHSPSDGNPSVDLDEALKWYAVYEPDADSYTVEFWQETCDGLATNLQTPGVTSTGASPEQLALSALTVGYAQTYSWRVRGVNNGGTGLGPWSETRSFRTEEGPGGWSLVSPPHAVTVSTTPLLQWQSYPDACAYMVRLQESGGGQGSHTAIVLATTSYPVPAGALQQQTPYTWWINALQDDGGAWQIIAASESRTFTTEAGAPPVLDPPMLESPAAGAVEEPLPVTLSWQGVTGASAYSVQVDDESSFSIPLLEPEAQPTGTTYSLDGLLSPGQSYHWRVCTVNSGGSCGGWVQASFTTAAPPSFSVAPSPLSFGLAGPGTTAQQSILVTNTGGGQLQGTITLSNDGNGAFALVGQPIETFDLGGGQGQAFTVEFTPPSATSYDGAVTLTHNAPPGSQVIVALDGTGTGDPLLQVAPLSLTLGTVVVGQTAQDTLTITNAGSGTLTGSFAMPSGTDFAFVSGSVDGHSGMFSLTAGQAQEVVVVFGPLGPGPQSTEIVFFDGLSVALDTLALSGTGTMSPTEIARYYYLTDHLGSVRATVNEEGTVVHFDDYYPFGMPMPGRSSMETPEAPRERFTGHEMEIDIDPDFKAVFYAGARYYDGLIGRWISVDPVEEKYPGLSPYTYVANNPLAFFDPNGEDIVVALSGAYKASNNRPLRENETTSGRLITAVRNFARDAGIKDFDAIGYATPIAGSAVRDAVRVVCPKI